MFSKELNKKLDQYHLLNHPFYKSWNEGKLTREIIKDYAEQYYQHVKAFPRYISATHSLCEDIEKRKILLENLQDEENKDADHPKLWKDFAVEMGADPEKIEKAKQESFTKDLIDNFFKQGRSSYAEGLASLYTYERQIPEIAETKIQGLKKHYGCSSKKGLEFFEAHKSADVYHRAECEKLLDGLSKDEQTKAEKAALSTALTEAFSHKGYILLVLGFFVCGFQITLVGTHVPGYMQDRGLGGWSATIILSLIGLFNIVGTLGMGYLGTKYSKKKLLSALYALRAIVICIFIFSPPSIYTAIFFGCTFGILWLSTIPPTNGIVAQIFGTKYLSLLFGIVFLSHQLGAFAGAYLGGYYFDLYGSYDYAWYIAIALSVFATLVHLPIDEKPIVRSQQTI